MEEFRLQDYLTDIEDSKIKEIICKEFGTPVNTLFNPSRVRVIVEVRQIYQYILHKILDVPLTVMEFEFKDIRGLQGFNHSNILYSCKEVVNKREVNKDYNSKYFRIKKKVNHVFGIGKEEKDELETISEAAYIISGLVDYAKVLKPDVNFSRGTLTSFVNKAFLWLEKNGESINAEINI